MRIQIGGGSAGLILNVEKLPKDGDVITPRRSQVVKQFGAGVLMIDCPYRLKTTGIEGVYGAYLIEEPR